MKPDLVFIFGLPGSGKSYVAGILEKQFGFFPYDGDLDIPDNMKDALFHKDSITDGMRREFMERMISSIKILRAHHASIAVHQTLLKEFMRKRISGEFPEAQFILIDAEPAIREHRYENRKYFNLGIPYLRHMSALFEKPNLPYRILSNSSEGSEGIITQLSSMFSDA